MRNGVSIKLSFFQNPTKKTYPLDNKILEENVHEVGREKLKLLKNKIEGMEETK